MSKEFKNPYFQTKEQPEQKIYEVNGPVITYYMPLEEVHRKYGPPGSLNGYEPSPLYGSRIR